MRVSELIEVLAKEIRQNGDNEILRMAVQGNTVAAEMGRIIDRPNSSETGVTQRPVNGPVLNI